LEISEKLFISNGTTKKHVSSILSKLGLKNRVEAVLFADKSEDFNLE
jgi:putative nitrate/nitrite response regulator protein narL